jgi:hypothetical protein
MEASMRLFVFLAFALVCAAPVARADDPTDPGAVQIDIRRWGVMVSEAQDLDTPQNGATAPVDVAADTTPQQIARSLRETAWRFNLARSEMCARGDLSEASCGAAFAADWLSEAPDAGVSYEELDRRSQELGAAVMPFWEAVCDRAKKQAPQEDRMSVCPME